MTSIPSPTSLDSSSEPNYEHRRWEKLLGGDNYVYGTEPGPLVRRVVRYHRAFMHQGGCALDMGCGEGQDLAFLASCGYECLGIDFIESGLQKAARLIENYPYQASVCQSDIREYQPQKQFDVIISSNSLQFLGKDAELCLKNLMATVAPGGMIGLSLFAREDNQPKIQGSLYFSKLSELRELFGNWQPLEASTLLQWNLSTGHPQLFVTFIARNTAPVETFAHVLS